MNLTKSKRNLLVTLLSFMVGMIYFIPFIRISFYDQTIAALNLTNTQLGFLGSIYGTLAIFCYAVGGILAQKFSPRILIGISPVSYTHLSHLKCTFWLPVLLWQTAVPPDV